MVEYKAMHDAGFSSGHGGVSNGYLSSYLSGKSISDAHPELQAKATQLADQQKNDYEADVQARAAQKRNKERNQK